MKKFDLIFEQVSTYGTNHSTDFNLLSIVVGAERVAKRLLEKYKTIKEISLASAEELALTQGVTKQRAVKIRSMFELGKRIYSTPLAQGAELNGSKTVFQHFNEKLKDLNKEHMFVCLLDSKHHILKEELVSIGSLTLSVAHPREIFKSAIRESAEAIILVHNHPSGNPKPSKEDIYTTKRVKEAGDLIGIRLLDHIIIGYNNYISFVEENLISAF